MKDKIETPKTFVVIAGEGSEDLTMALALSLTEVKRQLHEKFNGSPPPSFLSMMNHFSNSVNKEEIKASTEAVLNNKKNFMMILGGYKDNEEWNSALTEFMQENNVSATFISLDNQTVPPEITKLFHTTTKLSINDDNVVSQARNAVKTAREQSVVPFEKANMEPPPQLKNAAPTFN